MYDPRNPGLLYPDRMRWWKRAGRRVSYPGPELENELPRMIGPEVEDLCRCGALRLVDGIEVNESLPLERHRMSGCDVWTSDPEVRHARRVGA